MIGGFVSAEVLALLFLFFGLTIAVLVKKLRSIYPLVPYTPTLFLLSMVLGYLSPNLGILGESIDAVSKLNPHSILLIFLPPLIFESAFNADWYIFRKQSVQILILAFPSVFLSALFIMTSIKKIIQYDDSVYTWSEAFMFGSVLSCTDTVAVLALLKEAGAPRKFNSLIEGESLLNDGTCMILYTISLELVKGSAPPPLFIGQLFLELTLGAVALGVIFGFMSAYLISKVRNSPILTLNITVVSCYLLYFTAEYINLGIKISGIMALVSMGLYMAAFGKTKIAHESHEVVENFWKVYIFVAETIIFMLGGLIVGIQFLKPAFLEVLSRGTFEKLFYLYLCMTVCRFLSIVTFMPKLKSEGYGIEWKEIIALTYGGLRGAIGIAFTLILASNETLNPTFRMVSLFNTSGCAFLTLMINAPTCGYVIEKIGLCVKSEAKVKFFGQFMRSCEEELHIQIDEMKGKKYIENANWEKVEELAGIPELKEFIKENRESVGQYAPVEREMQAMNVNLMNEENVQENVDQALMEEIRYRFCVILKGKFWSQFEDNQCSSESVRMLIECVNIDLDSINLPLNSWDYLISHLHNPWFFPICFWLQSKPIIGRYAYSWIYNRVTMLYDAISTYLEATLECESACKELPYDDFLQSRVIKESEENRRLAENYLEYEIKISYYEIMRRVHTTKAAQSVLSFQKEIAKDSHNYGKIDDIFYSRLENIIEESITKLEKDSDFKEPLSDLEIVKEHEFFNILSSVDLKRLMDKKIDILLQKDEVLFKSYEKQKYIYLVTRGELVEEYRKKDVVVFRREVNFGELAGVGILLMNHEKDLEFHAISRSVVGLFAFPLPEIKDVIHKRQNLESTLYNEIFLLQVAIEPEIKTRYTLSQADWKRKKSFTTFKKLSKDEVLTVSACEIILAYGTILYQDQYHTSGYFIIRQGEATITGPAKLYVININPMENESESDDVMVNAVRSSIIRPSRASSTNKDGKMEDSVLRRTIFTRNV